MPGTVKDLLPSFLEYLKFEKRYSVHTVISYQTDLIQLDTYIQNVFGNMPLDEIPAPVLRSWLAKMKDENINTRSINRKISAVKSFYRYQLRKGILEKNPAALLKLMKTSKRLPGFLKEEDTEKIMQQPAEERDWKDMTRFLLMEVLYNCGLRVSELVGIKEKHADLRLRQIKVLGKGNKERVIPVKPELAEHIQSYLSMKRKMFEHFDAEYLFVNDRGLKLNTQYVYREVKHELAQYKNVAKKSPHQRAFR